MLGIGQKKGDGATGNGGEGGPGAGTGTRADNTHARTMRWVIAFKTLGGRDYLDQLQGFGAKLIVPMADGKTMMLFRSLAGSLSIRRAPSLAARKLPFRSSLVP